MAQLVTDTQDIQRDMSEVVASPRGSCVFLERFYQHKHMTYGRQYAKLGSVQMCSSRIRALLFPSDVFDIDMKNAMVTLVTQLLPIIDIGAAWPASVLAAWKDYGNDPDLVRIPNVCELSMA